MRIARRVQRIKPSATVSITARATSLREAGRDIIALSVGEPDFPTTEHICAAACEAISHGKTKYTVVDGARSLKEAVAQRMFRDTGIEVGLDEIIVSSGAKQSCFNACEALLEPGDEVIIPAPCWVSYPDMVRFADGNPVIVHTDPAGGFRLAPEQLAASITETTRAIIVNSPCNPTGASYSRADWQRLAEVLVEHPRVTIISDEIYDKLYWGQEPICGILSAAPELRSRIVTINGVSKSYSMTGWRIGYAIAPASLTRAMTTIQSQSTTNACSISQAAATAALIGDQACVAQMRDAFMDRQRYVLERLNAMPGLSCWRSDGTFYAFPDVREAIEAHAYSTDVELCEAILERTGVALVPGTAFAAPGYLRLSFAASSEMLQEALDRLDHFFA